MSRLVVDASVAVKWVVPESDSVAALALLDGSHELLAPELLLPEFGNVLWKKVRRGEIGPGELSLALDALARVPIDLRRAAPYLAAACECAVATGRTVYDSLYVVVAAAHGARLVTADERLVHALAGGPFAGVVVGLRDLR